MEAARGKERAPRPPLFSCSASLPESLVKQFSQGVVDRRLWSLFLFLKIINLSFMFFKKNVHFVKKKKKSLPEFCHFYTLYD